MSSTHDWIKRSDEYHYSQDDRTLAYKYQQEITPKIDAFLNNVQTQSIEFGPFNLDLEPWRAASIVDFRKYGIRIITKTNEENLVTFVLVKNKIGRTHVQPR